MSFSGLMNTVRKGAEATPAPRTANSVPTQRASGSAFLNAAATPFVPNSQRDYRGLRHFEKDTRVSTPTQKYGASSEFDGPATPMKPPAVSRSLGAGLSTTSSAATQSSSKAVPSNGGSPFAGMSQAQASQHAHGPIYVTSSPPPSPQQRKAQSSSSGSPLAGTSHAQAPKDVTRMDIWADLPTSNQPSSAGSSSGGGLFGDLSHPSSSRAPKTATPSTSSQNQRFAPSILQQAKAFQSTTQEAKAAQWPPRNNGQSFTRAGFGPTNLAPGYTAAPSSSSLPRPSQSSMQHQTPVPQKSANSCPVPPDQSAIVVDEMDIDFPNTNDMAASTAPTSSPQQSDAGPEVDMTDAAQSSLKLGMRSHARRLQVYAAKKDAGDLEARSEATEAFRLAVETRRRLKLSCRDTMVPQPGFVEQSQLMKSEHETPVVPSPEAANPEPDLMDLEDDETPVVPPPVAADPSPDSMDLDDDETSEQKHEGEAKEPQDTKEEYERDVNSLDEDKPEDTPPPTMDSVSALQALWDEFLALDILSSRKDIKHAKKVLRCMIVFARKIFIENTAIDIGKYWDKNLLAQFLACLPKGIGGAALNEFAIRIYNLITRASSIHAFNATEAELSNKLTSIDTSASVDTVLETVKMALKPVYQVAHDLHFRQKQGDEKLFTWQEDTKTIMKNVFVWMRANVINIKQATNKVFSDVEWVAKHVWMTLDTQMGHLPQWP